MRQQELSVSQRKLAVLFQKVNYGRINNLAVIKGEPVISPETTIELDVKLDSNDSHTPAGNNFQLKKKAADFFERLKQIREGFIHKIEIRGSLPIFMQVEGKIE